MHSLTIFQTVSELFPRVDVIRCLSMSIFVDLSRLLELLKLLLYGLDLLLELSLLAVEFLYLFLELQGIDSPCDGDVICFRTDERDTGEAAIVLKLSFERLAKKSLGSLVIHSAIDRRNDPQTSTFLHVALHEGSTGCV
jgi:hypothetical protein